MQEKPYQFLKSESNASAVRRPVFCSIGISTTCVLRCKMCFAWNIKYVKTLKEPTLNEWQHFIKLLGDFSDNSVEINFAGGEPLLDNRNLALINFSVKRGLPTSLHTNGVLIDKEVAYRIVDSGLNVITISLDGINKNTHDFLRGMGGCYDKVMQAIGYLDSCRDGLRIGLQTILLEQNLDEIVRLGELANEDKRIEYIGFQAIAHPFYTPIENVWYKKKKYSFLWPRDTKKVCTVVDELISMKKSGYKIANPISQLEAFKEYFTRPGNFIKKTKCNVDFWININHFGDIRMCECMQPVGNIKQDNPQDLWYSKKAAYLRGKIRNCRENCHILLNCGYEEERA